MNNNADYDVVVIGAGPSGALASSLLHQQGWRVLVLEKETFPRFSIGESLLPQCMSFLEDAGMASLLTERADELGFQFKDGAAFYHNGKRATIDFTQKFSAGPGTTFQVRRADFDKLLADGAEKQGVEIRYRQTVVAWQDGEHGAKLDVLDEQGALYQVAARFVLDASGFGRVLPRLLDLEVPSDFPLRSACFSHFVDGIDDPTFDRNKILITVHPEHRDVWYWLIPFSDGTASIGVVGEPSRLNEGDEPPAQVLARFISEDAHLATLLQNASPLGEARSIRGYSANVKTLAGAHFALLGNAGEFLDPVFSSGVTIALKSAHLIAPLLDRYLRGEAVDFDTEYAKPLQAGVRCFKTFVGAWYDTRFQDVIFYPGKNDQVRDMISAILAGYAWDDANPYVAQSERRLEVLAQLCREEA